MTPGKLDDIPAAATHDALVDTIEQDLRIRHDIESELQWDPRIDDRKIGVIVRHGLVTLTGEVYSDGTRDALEGIVRGIKGVQAIANEVVTHIRRFGECCDVDIAEAAVRALRSAVATRWAGIQPVVCNGVVTLQGEAKWRFQRRVAERLVGELPGIRRIVNLIAVRPTFRPAGNTDGPRSGRGPSFDSHDKQLEGTNMMNSDGDIRRNVENELAWEPSLDEKGIFVKVTNGIVTLGGSVPHYVNRWQAENVAKRVNGVRAIANDIEVNIPKSGERSDTEIATAAVNALKWHFALETCKIKPVVVHGRITLTGEVPYAYQKNLADGAVRYLSGVKSVTNDITVKPTVKPADIKQKIEAAFERQADLDAKQVSVNVDDTQVTLKGCVHSWREKDDAARAAWAAPGVAKVENQIQVLY